MRLVFRIGAAVPELRRIAVFRAETGTTLLQFERFPVERDRRRVEERPVKLLVTRIALVAAELIEVEDVRAEDEVVRKLFGPDLAPGGGSRQLKLAVGLAILLDVGVDPALFVVIPECPVGVRKRGIDLLPGKLRLLLVCHDCNPYVI